MPNLYKFHKFFLRKDPANVAGSFAFSAPNIESIRFIVTFFCSLFVYCFSKKRTKAKLLLLSLSFLGVLVVWCKTFKLTYLANGLQ